MTMFTTSAMTGLRMNRSVKLLDSMMGILRTTRSGIGGFGCRFGGRAGRVVHLHRSRVAQFEDAGGDHLLAWFDPILDGDQVAAGVTQFDGLLADAEVFLAILVLHFL